MKKFAPPPKKNSSQWKKNESLIAKNPTLRAARDRAEGFKPGSGISSADNSQEYKDNYDKIDWGKKDKTKPKFRVKINGVYQDEPNEEK
tara:strand:- start:327 stop:593 length:267 start_codon:yes stop_codon:yes gene_type:complete